MPFIEQAHPDPRVQFHVHPDPVEWFEEGRNVLVQIGEVFFESSGGELSSYIDVNIGDFALRFLEYVRMAKEEGRAAFNLIVYEMPSLQFLFIDDGDHMLVGFQSHIQEDCVSTRVRYDTLLNDCTEFAFWVREHLRMSNEPEINADRWQMITDPSACEEGRAVIRYWGRKPEYFDSLDRVFPQVYSKKRERTE